MRVTDWARPLFDWLVGHTYAVVFVATAIDATGLPFPGRILLAAAGGLAATGHVSLAFVIVAGALGATLTDQVWYLAGARGSQRLLDTYRRWTGASRWRARQDIDYFRRYGLLTVLLGRFVAVVRVVGWPMAAASGIGYVRFLVSDAAAALAWTATWVLLGWAIGDRWASTVPGVAAWIGIAGAAGVILVGVPLVWRWRQREGRVTASP